MSEDGGVGSVVESLMELVVMEAQGHDGPRLASDGHGTVC